MSEHPPQAAPPQYSTDGRWWWDGAQWTPARPAPKAGWSGTKIVLVIVASSVAVIVLGLAALLALTAPVGTQLDTDDLGGDYCKIFPEDC